MSNNTMSNETQVALLAQKLDFLTAAVTKLEGTMQSVASSVATSDKRHEELEIKMEYAVEQKVKELMREMLEKHNEHHEQQPEEAKATGFIQRLIDKPWFGYFIFALLLFGKEVLPILLHPTGAAK